MDRHKAHQHRPCPSSAARSRLLPDHLCAQPRGEQQIATQRNIPLLRQLRTRSHSSYSRPGTITRSPRPGSADGRHHATPPRTRRSPNPALGAITIGDVESLRVAARLRLQRPMRLTRPARSIRALRLAPGRPRIKRFTHRTPAAAILTGARQRPAERTAPAHRLPAPTPLLAFPSRL
jgi:hypothetical protein